MFKIALKYGLLIVVFLFLWLTLEYMVGLRTDYVRFHPLATLLSLVIPLLFLYYGMREAQKSYRGVEEFTYGKAFQTGILITLVVAVLSPIGQWLFFSVLAPDFFDSMQPNVEAQKLSQDIDAEVARREGEEPMYLSAYLMQSALGYLIAGVVMSAILAIFVRDKALPKGG